MIATEFRYEGKILGYEVLDDGYFLFLDDALWMIQKGENIFNPILSYEENALLHIRELCGEAFEIPTAEEEKISELEQTVLETAISVEYLICLAELDM